MVNVAYIVVGVVLYIAVVVGVIAVEIVLFARSSGVACEVQGAVGVITATRWLIADTVIGGLTVHAAMDHMRLFLSSTPSTKTVTTIRTIYRVILLVIHLTWVTVGIMVLAYARACIHEDTALWRNVLLCVIHRFFQLHPFGICLLCPCGALGKSPAVPADDGTELSSVLDMGTKSV